MKKESIKNFTSFDSVLKEHLKNPKIKEAYDYEDLVASVAIQIAALREKRKLSQAKLADLMHTSQQVVSKIEKAEENLTFKTLFRAARALNKRVELRLV